MDLKNRFHKIAQIRSQVLCGTSLTLFVTLITGCTNLAHKMNRWDVETSDFKPIPSEQSLVTNKDQIAKAEVESKHYLSMLPITPVGVECRMTVPELDEMLSEHHKKHHTSDKPSLSSPVLTKNLIKFEGILSEWKNKKTFDEKLFSEIKDEKIKANLRSTADLVNALSTFSHFYAYFLHRYKRFATFSTYSDGINSTSLFNINNSYYRTRRFILAINDIESKAQGWFENEDLRLRSSAQLEWLNGMPFVQSQTFDIQIEGRKISFIAKVSERYSESDPTPKVVTIQNLGPNPYSIVVVFEECKPLE